MKPALLLSSIALGASVLLAGCGASTSDYSSSSGSSTSSTSSSSTSSSACSSTYRDTVGYSSMKSRNTGNAQCLTLLDGAESYRQVAIANCQAGATSAANTNYTYYQKTATLLSSVCN